MKVTLLEHTPDPEKLVAMAAKLCYSSSDIDHLKEGLDDNKTKSFILNLMNMHHESPLEHVTFTFGIEGISRACSHQLVRHRIASYSQKSQRYVDEGGFKFVTPPAIQRDTHDTLVDFSEVMEHIGLAYNAIQESLKKQYVKNGMDEKAAEKLANEDARFVLPNACETSIIVTMNIRSLFNFFKHRCCNRAQWEIRELAMKMWKQCVEVAPQIFAYAGPDCITKGYCPEGKMSCGKMKEKKAEFQVYTLRITHS